MTFAGVWKLGVGALAVVAAGCTEPWGSSSGSSSGSTIDGRPVEGRRVDPLVWGGEQKLVASDAAELNQLGESVSLGTDDDGNVAVAVVGAYGESGVRGAAYVFAKSDNAWTEDQKLVASDGVELDRFGWSVSLGPDRVAVGAYGADANRGAAYVFVESGGAWAQEQKLVASDGAAGDNFGYAVSFAGDRLVVGAYGKDTARGAAYVFVRNGSAWTEEQKLVASDGGANQDFGWSVSLAADRVMVGAPGKDGFRGAAYVFVRNGSAWTEEQKLVASDAADYSQLGNAVSLGADRALVGASWDHDLRGAAYFFVRSSGAWTEEQKLVASDAVDGEQFGSAISLVANRALIGASGSDFSRGAAYLFAQNGSAQEGEGDGAWTEEERLIASDGKTLDRFGWSVSLAGDRAGDRGIFRALVGAFYTDQLRGTAYLFSVGLANGDPCSADPGCASGHCVDNLCCDSACTGACCACSIAEGAAADGTCTIFPAGSEARPACGGLTCNGESPECGSCRSDTDCPAARYCAADRTCEPRGELTPCTRGDECASGHCEDGICCDRGCSPSERCRADLKISGADGTCGPASAAALGAPCKFDVQCTSGHCADGVCRDPTSGGQDAGVPRVTGPGDDPGCGCRTGGAPTDAAPSSLGVAFALLLVRRARRRRLRETGTPA